MIRPGSAIGAAASSVALLATLTVGSSDALACSPDTVDIDRVVGFHEDGRYVTFERSWSSYDEGIADESFTLHDQDGATIAALVAEWDDEAKVTRWRSGGTGFFEGLAATDDEAPRIEKAHERPGDAPLGRARPLRRWPRAAVMR